MRDRIVLADINNLDDVLTKLEQFPKDRWRKFGLRCGLHYVTLETIQANYPRDAEECFTKCVVCWLRREDGVDKKGKPTLQRLADIVEAVGDRATAENIRSQIKKKRKRKIKKMKVHTHIQYLNRASKPSVQSNMILRWILVLLALIALVLVVVIIFYCLHSWSRSAITITVQPRDPTSVTVQPSDVATIQPISVTVQPRDITRDKTLQACDKTSTVTDQYTSQVYRYNDDSTSVIDQYVSQLCEFYNNTLTKQMNLNFNKFPAAGPYVPFIPLISIIVLGNRKKDADQLLSTTVEEVLQNEEIMKIPIEDILKPVTNQRLRLVLIEGEPGIGKSTLAKELVLRWVNQSDQFLNKHKIVIFIQLRFGAYHNVTSVYDLFIDTGEIEMKELISEVKKSKGTGVLWILDGFDELPYHLRNLKEQSVFIQLINGTILPKSTVIVTGRPVASRPLLRLLENDSKRISLRGFDSNKTLEYAKNYFKDNGTLLDFQSYYSGNSMIENMLYNPMNCYIVCTIFNDFIANGDKQYPRTMTELYNKYIHILLKRHLIDAKLVDDIDYKMPQKLIQESHFKFLELDLHVENIWNNFSLLSEIAYKGTIEQQYIFGSELHNVTKLSMMDTIVGFYVFDPDESSSFIHTTLQEYFAAVYLINNPDVTSIFNSNNLRSNPNLKVVLTFYVGMLKMINREVGSETLAILKHYYDDLKFLRLKTALALSTTLLMCLYEHDSLLYNISSSLVDYTHDTSYPTNFECYIIGYLVAIHNITFTVYFSDPTHYKALNKGLQSHLTVKGKIKIIVFQNYKNVILAMLEEIINLPSHMSIITFDYDRKALVRSCSLHHVKILLRQIISKFKSLQKIFSDYVLLNSTPLGCHPLLNLTQLNELTLEINCSQENDLDLLKNLITPIQPLRKLTVSCYKNSTFIVNVLNLIKNQSSLEELRIIIKDLKGIIVWYKSNNSLEVFNFYNYSYPSFKFNTVKRELNYQLLIISSVGIQLTSFTFYNYSSRHEELNVDITIYSKPVKSELGSFINTFKKSLEMVPTDNTVRKCYKIQLNYFIYGLMYAIINHSTDLNFDLSPINFM